MTPAQNRKPTPPAPTPIDASALENLRYIRDTIAAAGTFTTVPGKGCIAMGVTALVASGLESVPALAPAWLPIWVGAVALGWPASGAPALLALGFGGLHIALGVIIIKDHGG